MRQYRVMTRIGKKQADGVVAENLLSYTLDGRVVAAISEEPDFFTLQLTRRNGDSINVIRLSEEAPCHDTAST